MQRKWHWPFITVILTSFLLGAVWGVKLIRDRAAEEGRLEADAVLNILAPTGFLPKELLIEFQKRERIQVIVHEESFPSALLRRALKASPGQYDAAIVFHYQVSALRNERRMISLYDSRVKFPTNIAPDFRKLPDDRNLMDTAPLQWGLLGTAGTQKEEVSNAKTTAMRFGFWPSILIGGEATDTPTQNFVTTLQASLEDLRPSEPKSGLTYFLNSKLADVELALQPPSSIVVSHGSLAFPPLKEMNLELRPFKSSGQNANLNSSYMLWILTAVAMADGDLERNRKLVRFLLDPVQNLKLVQNAKAGATTLRYQDGFDRLPPALQSSYFRKFPLDKIRIERDERVRQADDLLEQSVLGAAITSKPVAVVETKPSPKPTAKPVAESTPRPITKSVAKPIPNTPSNAIAPQPQVATPANEPTAPIAKPAETDSPSESESISEESPATEPSEEPLPAD